MTQNIRQVGFGPNDDVVAQVDRYNRAIRVSNRPWEHDAGGHYRTSARSGVLTSATVAAGGVLAAFQWNVSSIAALILRVRAYYVPTTVFTAAQELGLDLVRATAFPIAYTAGTAMTPTPMRATMPLSSVSDFRIAPATVLTAPATLPTFDANPIEIGGGLVNVVNAAAATAYVNPGPFFGFDYEARVERGEFPLVLTKGMGFAIRNTVVFPAAGAATLVVNVVHIEIPTPSSLIIPA